MNKNKFTIGMLAAMFATIGWFASCSTDYDGDVIAKLNEIERLKQEDAAIRGELMVSVTALKKELLAQVDAVEQRLGSTLEAKFSAAIPAIDAVLSALNNDVNTQTALLAEEVTDKLAAVKAHLATEEAKINAAKTALHNKLQKAINDGDAALQAQLTSLISQIDTLGENVDELDNSLDNANLRFDEMEGVTARVNALQPRIDDLKDKMDANQTDDLLNDIRAAIADFTADYLAENTPAELDAIENKMASLLDGLIDLGYEYSDYSALLAGMEYNVSTYVSDAEQVYDNLEDLASKLEEIESSLSDFESILDESIIDDVWIGIMDVYTMANRIEDILSEIARLDPEELKLLFQTVIDNIQTHIDEAEKLDNDLDDIIADLDGLQSDADSIESTVAGLQHP